MGTPCPHLATPEQFKAVLKHAPAASTDHFALHLELAAASTKPTHLDRLEGQTAIGVVLPKRLAKRAVTRNAIRRQIYAVLNDACQVWTGAQAIWVVLRLKAGFAVANVGPSASSLALKRMARAELTHLAGQLSALVPRMLRKHQARMAATAASMASPASALVPTFPIGPPA